MKDEAERHLDLGEYADDWGMREVLWQLLRFVAVLPYQQKRERLHKMKQPQDPLWAERISRRMACLVERPVMSQHPCGQRARVAVHIGSYIMPMCRRCVRELHGELDYFVRKWPMPKAEGGTGNAEHAHIDGKEGVK